MKNQLSAFMQLDRSVRLYLFVNLLIGFGLFGIQMVLLNLYLASLDFDPVFIGNFNGIGQLAWAISAIPGGLIGTRLGLRGTTAAGYGVVTLGMALILLTAPLLPTDLWPGMLMAGNLIAWAGAGLCTVNGLPYLIGVAPEDQRDKIFTFLGVATALGGFIGNLMAGFLPGWLLALGGGAISQSTAYNLALWLVVPTCLACMLVMLKARPAPSILPASQAGVQEKTPIGLLAFLVLLFSVLCFSEGGFFTFLNLFLSEELGLSTGLIGGIYAAGKPLMILTAPLLLLAFKRLGPGWTMSLAQTAIGICALVVGLLVNPVLAVIVAILYFPLSNFTITGRNLFSQQVTTPRWRAMSSAVLTLSMAFGFGGAALLGGRIIAFSGYSGLFLLSGMVASLGFILFVLYRRVKAKAPSAAPAETPAG